MGGGAGKKREREEAVQAEPQADPIRIRLRWRQGDELTEVQVLAKYAGELLSRARELLQPEDEQTAGQTSKKKKKKKDVAPSPVVIFCGHDISGVPGEAALRSLFLGAPGDADGIVAWAALSKEHLEVCITLQEFFLEVCEGALRDRWQCSVAAGDVNACNDHMGSAQIACAPEEGADHGAAIMSVFADPCVQSPAKAASHMLSWQDDTGRNALSMAVDAADGALCELLVTARADVNEVNDDLAPLDRCLERSDVPDALARWLCLGQGASVAAWHLSSPSERCFKAAATGRTWLVEEMLRREGFLDKVADVVRMPSHWTLLHEAVVNCDEELVQFVVESAPTLVSARDRYHRTPLHYAAQEGHSALLPLLASARGVEATSLDAADLLGRSPLLAASRGGHAACSAWFVECHCDPLLRDKVGTSAVWQAACAPAGLDSPQQVLPLLLQGYLSSDGPARLDAEVLRSTTDDDGFTLMHAAARENATPAMIWMYTHLDPAAAAELLAASTHKGESALRLACFEGHVEAADLLLRWGAGHAPSSNDSDLRAWALSLGHEDVAALLWERGPEDGEAVRGARMLAYASASSMPPGSAAH